MGGVETDNGGSGGWRMLSVLLGLAIPALYLFAVFAGSLNQDEGWYLYAGRMVAECKKPFVDFASTQGPLMAYIYAAAQLLVGYYGVLGGRFFTALLGMATLAAAMLLARRAVTDGCEEADSGVCAGRGRAAALLTALLLGGSLYHVYFTSIVKTYSLAGLFVMLGYLGLQRGLAARAGRRQALVGGFIGGACFAAAAGVRLSAGILLPAVWLALVWQAWRGGRGFRDGEDRDRSGTANARAGSREPGAGTWAGTPNATGTVWRVALGMLAGGCLVLPAIYLPFVLAAPEAVKFGLLEYHGGREVGSAAAALVYKGGFLVRLAGAYFPLLCAALASVWLLSRNAGGERAALSRRGSGIPVLLLAGFAAVTAVHLAAEFPYDDYEVFIMPAAAVAVALVLAPWLARSKSAFFLIMSAVLMHSLASPMLQSWLLAPRDRIWWPLRSETSLQRLDEASEAVKEIGGYRGGKCATLLTQDTYLAVQAGLRVPRGMELGPFCYFPDMELSRAKACHVLNRDMLRRILRESDAPAAAFSGYGLAIRCPEVTPLDESERAELLDIVEERYRGVTNLVQFGQADTTLRILKCKKEE